jgi:hypothetical protein
LFDGGVFKVQVPDPQDDQQVIDIPDAWTSDFLVEAMDLIVARAKWEVYAQHHDDLENASKEDSLVEDALSRLRRESDARDAELQIMPTDMSTADIYSTWD